MPDAFTVKAVGFKELEDVLVQMGEELGYDKPADKVLIPAARSAMEPVLARARMLAPYDESNTSGVHMRDTLRVTARRPNARDKRSQYVEQNDAVIATVTVRTDKRAISQEFGNAQHDAQPFLRPALESQADNVVNRLGTFLTYKLSQYKSKKV
jgi:HK97 gp10 family phage protein